MLNRLPAAFLFVIVIVLAATGHANEADLDARVIARGLHNPWGLAFLNDGSFLVTERPGSLRRVMPDGRISASWDGVPEVWAQRQGGLLDILVIEQHSGSGRLFLTYSKPGAGGAGTAVHAADFTYSEAGGSLVGGTDIFEMNRFDGSGVHFGSRLVLAPDGNLFVTLGERGTMERAQDPFDLAGAVVRIAQDGSVPADNPFSDGANAHPAIWSTGHRNPQGATLGPDRVLWTIEHGAKGGDELNRPEAGLNYGWPVITYGVNYNNQPIGIGQEAEGFEQPVYYWDPSIAPSGLAFYQADLIPDWRGDLLVGALKYQMLVRLDMENGQVVGEERLFRNRFGRIRDVRVGPDGAVYLLTDERDGMLIRIAPKGQ